MILAAFLLATQVEVSVSPALEGPSLCTIVADSIAVDRVIESLAIELSRVQGGRNIEVRGFPAERRAAIVTVELRNRPVPLALEYVLGSVGLDFVVRPDAISVFTPPAATADELQEQAMLSYLQATSRYPDHPSAPKARIYQGQAEEQRGNLSAAVSHYEAVRQNYRQSEFVHEAAWRMGKVFQAMGNWSEANLEFRGLANQPGNGYEADARVEMARCSIELGDALRATHILSALDSLDPQPLTEQHIKRELVRARALTAIDKPMEALRALRGILAEELRVEERLEVFLVQAGAFEGLEMPAEAALAWQAVAQEALEPMRSSAFANAARLSLEAGQELNALVLHEEAEQLGIERVTEPFAAEAKQRLGLSTGEAVEVEVPVDGLGRARNLIAAGDFASATHVLEPIFGRRAQLTPEKVTELYTLWALVVDRRRGLDAAIRMLRTARPGLEDLEHRRQLDITAAELFEQYQLYDQAVDAYEGRY